jgi:hypothetical protein
MFCSLRFLYGFTSDFVMCLVLSSQYGNNNLIPVLIRVNDITAVAGIIITTLFIVRGCLLNPPDGHRNQYVHKLATP